MQFSWKPRSCDVSVTCPCKSGTEPICVERIWMGRGKQGGTGGRLQTDRTQNCCAAGGLDLKTSKLRLKHSNLRGSSLTRFNRPRATRVAAVWTIHQQSNFSKTIFPTSTNSLFSDRRLSIAAEPSKTKTTPSGSPCTSLLPVFSLDWFHGTNYPEMFPLSRDAKIDPLLKDSLHTSSGFAMLPEDLSRVVLGRTCLSQLSHLSQPWKWLL